MGIFQRAHDIVQAKTNKALDAAEKPDEMLDLSYEKMLEQITQVRRALVDLAASKKRLELQQEQFQHTVDHLQDQAKQALQANREDLAKEALSRKAAAQQQIDEMEPQRQQLDEEEKKLTKTLDALQKRVNDFRTQKETLKAQYTAAKADLDGRREHGRHLEVLQRLGGGAPAGAGQDLHHAGPLGRPRRAARVRRARGRGRWHRRHPKGARPGRHGRPGRQRAGRPEGAAGHRRARPSPTRRAGAPAAPAATPEERRRPRPQAAESRPRARHDVGQFGTPVLLDEVTRARDGDVGTAAAPGTCAWSTSAHPRSRVAVGEGGEEWALEAGERLDRAPVQPRGPLDGVSPMSSGSWRGPAQNVSSGNGAS